MAVEKGGIGHQQHRTDLTNDMFKGLAGGPALAEYADADRTVAQVQHSLVT